MSVKYLIAYRGCEYSLMTKKLFYTHLHFLSATYAIPPPSPLYSISPSLSLNLSLFLSLSHNLGPVLGVIFDMDGTLSEPGAISYDLMYSRTGNSSSVCKLRCLLHTHIILILLIYISLSLSTLHLLSTSPFTEIPDFYDLFFSMPFFFFFRL